MNKTSFLYINLLFVLFFLFPVITQAKDKTFTLVIDAGHGGKDPGARGTIIDEKVINLSVALKLGALISETNEDVRVIYTRKTDCFIELDERANIANRNKADLFISIHTNSVKRGNTVQGTETYTLGLARSDENLEVAMRENSAILLEDDYLQKYEGFDPNSSESYIIFEFMQNKHMEQSVSLASEVQKSFVSSNRTNRGVRQAGFLVLRKTSMPSILVELGYISNREEERFMKSSEGQSKLAGSLYAAFVKYKKEYDRKQGALTGNKAIVPDFPVQAAESEFQETKVLDASSAPVGSEEYILQRKKEKQVKKTSVSSSVQMNTSPRGKVIYKIQILTSDKKVPSGSRLFKGYKNIDYFTERGIYKYTYGETSDFNSIRKLRRTITKDFKDAFIVAFKDGERVKY